MSYSSMQQDVKNNPLHTAELTLSLVLNRQLGGSATM